MSCTILMTEIHHASLSQLFNIPVALMNTVLNAPQTLCGWILWPLRSLLCWPHPQLSLLKGRWRHDCIVWRSFWKPFSLYRSKRILDKLHPPLCHTSSTQHHKHEQGSISCCTTPTPTSSGYSPNRCFIGIICAVRCVSTQINNTDSSYKTHFSIWTQSGAICGTLQLCDEQRGDGEGWGGSEGGLWVD